MGAVPRDRQESIMATIGTFTKTGDSYNGAVKTLSINAKTSIKPADKASDKAPDFGGPVAMEPRVRLAVTQGKDLWANTLG